MPGGFLPACKASDRKIWGFLRLFHKQDAWWILGSKCAALNFVQCNQKKPVV